MFDRKKHWQDIYQNKSPLEVSWYQKKPTLSLELIHHARLAREDSIIDVGGGASLLVDHLQAEGFTNLAVLDISEQALASAKERLGETAEGITWLTEDVTDFTPPRQFSLWHDRAVFHFLTEQVDRQNYLKTLKQALKPNGQLIIAAFAVGGPEKCSGLEIVQYDAKKLGAELGQYFELLEEGGETHLTPTNHEQQFAYFRYAYLGENF